MVALSVLLPFTIALIALTRYTFLDLTYPLPLSG